MAPSKPLLDDVELQQVQNIESDHDQVLTQHQIPGLEGDFLQHLGRKATHVSLNGVLTGPEAGEGLKALREKFHAAEPIPFVADLTVATQVDQVLIEKMGVRELAGKPERFEYAFTLREFIAPPPVVSETPPELEIPIPDPPAEDIDQNVGTLIVEINVEGQPNFDFSRVTVTVQGTQENGEAFSRSLTNRTDNIWTEEGIPASQGEYTVQVVETNPQPLSGSATAAVRAGQTARVAVTLRLTSNIAKTFIVHFRFDNAFVEPCMRAVMRQVAEHARDHPDEKLVIVGHTDLAGTDAYNQSLSERRARSAHAYLTFGRDRTAAVEEWNQLRRRQSAGSLSSINDTWGTREYQYILQDLGYYSGSIDDDHGSMTDAAVRNFRVDRQLSAYGDVGDNTWPVLIEAYLAQDELAVPETQFLPNAKDGCDGGVVKWLGCGEKDPVRNTEVAWRPNRRTEFLFVRTDTISCEIPQPDTFELPAPGAVGSSWCLGPGDANHRCCLVVPHLVPGTNDPQPCPSNANGRWCRQPAEPGSFLVRGSIRFEDGTPLANAEYVLIAPDGQFMDGEHPSSTNRGLPIPGRTAADGTFNYPDQQKGIGIYTLEVNGRFLARLAGSPPDSTKGNVVCKRLDGSTEFDVVVVRHSGDPSESGPFHVGEKDYDEGTFVIPPIPGETNRQITANLRALVRYPAQSSGRNKPVATEKATYPLVLISHGQHRVERDGGTPIRSHEGFEYLARHLASHGYIAVSIDHNDLNRANVGGIHRARLILRHIDVMEQKASTDPQLAGKTDLDNIALLGHSRGGLAIASAQQLNVDEQLGRNIRALVAIAPVSSDDLQLPSTPITILLGSADQDVGDSSAELYSKISAPKSMIYLYGAIHAFFNTHPDWVRPGGTLFGERDIARKDSRVIRPVDHLNCAKGYSLAFLELTLRNVTAFQPYFSQKSGPDNVAGVETHRQIEFPGALTVDDFEQSPRFIPKFPDQSGDAINTLGFSINFDRIRYEEFIQFSNDTRVGFIDWDVSHGLDGEYRTSLRDQGTSPLDVSGVRVLSIRTALEMHNRVDEVSAGVTRLIADSINPPNQPQKFTISLVDVQGRTASVSTDVISLVPYPYLHHNDLRDGNISSESHFILKTIRVPLSLFLLRNSNLDISQLTEIRFQFQETPSGGISIDGIQLSQ